MTKKEQLIAIKNDYTRHEIKHIELHWTTGEKAGIGNKAVCDIVMATIMQELQRQIDECDKYNKSVIKNVIKSN